MNHGYYGIYNKNTTLVLGHRKFTTDKPLALWAWGLSVVNFLRPWTRVVYLLYTPNNHGLDYKYTAMYY